jgi:syntaxin 8
MRPKAKGHMNNANSLTVHSHTKEQEDQLIRIQVKVDKLDALLSPAHNNKSTTDRDLLLGNHSQRGGIRFDSSTDQEDHSNLENDQILLLQQRIMDGKRKK